MKKITLTLLSLLFFILSTISKVTAQSEFSCSATGNPICNCNATEGWGAQVEENQAYDYSTTFGLFGSVLPFDRDLERDGQWSGTVQKNWGIIPAHAILTPKGKVLSFGTGITSANRGTGERGSGNGDYEMMFHIYDPITQQGRILETQIRTDLFCAAAEIVPQTGQILITGGDVNYNPDAYDEGAGRYDGIVQSNIYDPNTEAIDADPFGNMEFARWYPTVASLGDGSVLVVGGRDEFGAGVGPSELYVPGEGYRTLTGTDFEELVEMYWYPRVHQLSNGSVLIVLPDNNNQGQPLPTKNESEGLWLMDVKGQGSVVKIGEKPFVMGVAEPSAQIGEDLFLFIDITGELWTLDMTSGAPDWRTAGKLPQRLAWSNMCLMPDGDVMISGGSESDNKLGGVNFDSFLWNRETLDITVIAKQSEERLYHSCTVLLQDGTIMSLGGGGPGPIVQNNSEIYRPPYLFDGSGNFVEDRFNIQEYSASIHPGEDIKATIDTGVNVSRITLVKHSSTTHAVNMGAKFLEPEWSQEGNTLTINTIDNSNVFLPGAWMIFIFDENGVPAVAKTVHVDIPIDSDIEVSEDSDFTETGNGNDRIVGTPGNDVIDAGFGNDEVYGEPGDDVLIGGYGYDLLYGGTGSDYIFGKPLPVPIPAYYFRMDESVDNFAAAAGFNYSHENAYKFFLGNSNEWTRTGSFDGGAAVIFKGGSTGGGMKLGNSLTLGEGVSVSAFVRFDDLEGGNWQRVFDFSNGSLSNNILLSQVKDTDDIAFQIFQGGTRVSNLIVENIIVEGEWAHWTAVISDTGDMSLYKNGVLIGKTTGQAPITVSRQEIYLGDSPVSNDSTLDGAISNVAIFDQELNSDQVAVIYGQVLHGEPLVAYPDGDDFLSGDEGNDILDGGAGNDELIGGQGDDFFVFSDISFGYDTVTDWNNGDNQVVFAIPNISYSNLILTQEEGGVGVTIEGVEESYIALTGTTLSDFSETDFIFDPDFYDLSSIVDLSDFYREIDGDLIQELVSGIFRITQEESDVFNEGVTIEAINGASFKDGDITVNGVTFTNDSSLLSGDFIGDYFGDVVGNGDYDTLLSTIDAGGRTGEESLTLTFDELEVGQEYVFQYWYAENATQTRTMTLTASGTAGGNVEMVLDNSSGGGTGGRYALVFFTADATTQEFTLTSDNGGVRLTAYQLRKLIGDSSLNAPISWTVSPITGNASEVVNTGTTIEALNGAGYNGETITVNGVTFTSNGSLLGRSTNRDFYQDLVGEGSYDKLLSSIDFGRITTEKSSLTISFSDLVPGQDYVIQYWYAENSDMTRTMTVTASGTTETGFLDGVLDMTDGETGGRYAIGTFTALDSTQDFTILSSDERGVRLTAYQLRLLSETSGVEVLTLKSEVKGTVIYPNPASDYVDIYTTENMEVKQAHIYDSSGRIIESYEVNYKFIQNDSFSIRIDHLENALYIIKLDMTDGTFETHNLIVKKD